MRGAAILIGALLADLPAAAGSAAAPSVTGFTPDHGPPGTLVKIIGADFVLVFAVEFGGVEAARYRVVADNHIKAVVPEGAVTGPIRIRTTSGSALSAKSFVVELPWSIPPDLEPRLALPRPTPTRGTVSLRFTLPRPARARLAVHDVRGRRLAWLADEELATGEHERAWDGRDREGRAAPPGVYLAVLSVEGRRLGRRILVIP
jgi:hypothetical protein